MAMLSVNVNKIALLRNSRGRDFPSVVEYVRKIISLGVKGITVHPRPDERHITRQDIFDISECLTSHSGVEFNIEGYPSEEFLKLVVEVSPDQCTLVPDNPEQLTSDHGWKVSANRSILTEAIACLRESGVRSSVFLDPQPTLLEQVSEVGADRIELYTEEYASKFNTPDEAAVWQSYADTARAAAELNIGVNGGHDLDLKNLARFLEIPEVREVSIGHALVVEALDQGIRSVIEQYLRIVNQ